VIVKRPSACEVPSHLGEGGRINSTWKLSPKKRIRGKAIRGQNTGMNSMGSWRLRKNRKDGVEWGRKRVSHFHLAYVHST